MDKEAQKLQELRNAMHLILVQLIKDHKADDVEGYGSKAVDQLLALIPDKLPKDKPPISMGIEEMMNELREWIPENILQNTFLPYFRGIAQAQREADIKWYEGGIK